MGNGNCNVIGHTWRSSRVGNVEGTTMFFLDKKTDDVLSLSSLCLAWYVCLEIRGGEKHVKICVMLFKN